MKIALCFAGQPRFVRQAYNNIRKNLIIPNEITDIFVHTWFRDEFESIGYRNAGRMYKTDLNFIETIYKPKKILIENDLTVPLHKYDIIINNSPTKESGYRRKDDLSRTIPGWYSRYKVNCLKNEYKIEANIDKYDAVIITRFDLYINEIIKIDELDLNKVNCHSLSWKETILENEKYKYVGDIINIGNEKIMDKYAEIYNNMPNISKYVEIFVGESLVGYQLFENNIEFIESWNNIRVYRS